MPLNYLFTYSFNKELTNSYYVPGTLPGAADLLMKKIYTFFPHELLFWLGRLTLNK